MLRLHLGKDGVVRRRGGGACNVGKCRIHIWVDRRAINNNDFVWINSALLSQSADLNIPNGLLPASID